VKFVRMKMVSVERYTEFS